MLSLVKDGIIPASHLFSSIGAQPLLKLFGNNNIPMANGHTHVHLVPSHEGYYYVLCSTLSLRPLLIDLYLETVNDSYILTS